MVSTSKGSTRVFAARIPASFTDENFAGPNKYHRCGFRFTLTFFSQGPNVPYRRHHVPTEKVAIPVVLKVPHLGSCARESLMMRRTLSSETGSSAFLDPGCV
ncbi:hypothetical protein FCV25MIE_27592 [Fagus crenata]